MTKTKGILLASFCLAFAAGTSLGLFINRPAASAAPALPTSQLAKALNLTTEQQEQMRKIWSNAWRAGRHSQQWRTLSEDRDEKIQKLLAQLSDEQRAQYDAVQQEHSRKSQELSQALSQERDQKILALMPDELRASYQQTTQQYAAKFEELSQEQRKANDEAVALTKQILTPEQAVKYDKWQKEHHFSGRGGRSRGLTTASRPATSEQSTRGAEQPQGG